MNKINIDVFVPTLNQTYNLFVPVNKSIGETVELLNKAINELTEHEFPISNNLSLINVKNGEAFDFNFDIKNSKIKNGSKVILM